MFGGPPLGAEVRTCECNLALEWNDSTRTGPRLLGQVVMEVSMLQF